MDAISLLVFDFGDRRTPPSVDALLKGAKMRKDRQPDRRTREGRVFAAYFRRESERFAEAYRRGAEADFVPSELDDTEPRLALG